MLYSNNTGEEQETALSLSPQTADYILHPLTESFACYDAGAEGTAVMDGYHWSIEFYGAKGLLQKMEGWPGEPEWRHKAARDLFSFVERQIQKDLGTQHMKFE